jgi:hypothetical protein
VSETKDHQLEYPLYRRAPLTPNHSPFHKAALQFPGAQSIAENEMLYDFLNAPEIGLSEGMPLDCVQVQPVQFAGESLDNIFKYCMHYKPPA